MHEMSLVQSIIKQVEAFIGEQKITQVSTVTVSVGALSGVDVDSLTFWFPVVAQKSCLARANLVVQRVEGCAKCQDCQARYALPTLLTPCPVCNSYQRAVIAGKELFIQSIEVT